MIFGGLFDFDKKEEEIKKLEEITKESNFWDDVSLANKKITELNNKDYHEYLKKLKKDKAFDNILADSFPRKIKKICLKISPKLFWKIMR